MEPLGTELVAFSAVDILLGVGSTCCYTSARQVLRKAKKHKQDFKKAFKGHK